MGTFEELPDNWKTICTKSHATDQTRNRYNWISPKVSCQSCSLLIASSIHGWFCDYHRFNFMIKLYGRKFMNMKTIAL